LFPVVTGSLTTSARVPDRGGPEARRLRIGEVAARAGVSTKTIRYYEDVGLLAPARRAANGYRLFEAGTVERLSLISSLQWLGLHLGEIRAVLAVNAGAVPCSHVWALVIDLPARLGQRMADTATVRAALAEAVAAAHSASGPTCRPQPSTRL
jgi:DNA-binding transcriptional MerR regulator